MGTNLAGSEAEHFRDVEKSTYDSTLNFNVAEMSSISGYSYVHIGGIATCENPAVCEDCGRPYGNALGHKLIKTEAKEAACLDDGNMAYWTCEECKKYFADAEGKTEIELADTVIKATGHKYEEGKCIVCEEIDSAFKPIITEGANRE